MDKFKLIAYFIISIIVNCSFLAGIYSIFNNSIWIEFHLKQNIVFAALTIFLISTIIVSKSVSELFGENISKSILRILTTILLVIFSLNLFILVKSIINVFSYQNKIFVCKVFTIYYKYPIIARRLTLKENVKAYCEYEVNALWPKILKFFENSIAYSLEHPWVIVGTVSGIVLMVAYLLWNYIKNS